MAASEGSLRKRKVTDVASGPGLPPVPGPDAEACPTRLRAGTFWLTRIVLLKALALVYCECAVSPGLLSVSRHTARLPRPWARLDDSPRRSCRPTLAQLRAPGTPVRPAPPCSSLLCSSPRPDPCPLPTPLSDVPHAVLRSLLALD